MPLKRHLVVVTVRSCCVAQTLENWHDFTACAIVRKDCDSHSEGWQLREWLHTRSFRLQYLTLLLYWHYYIDVLIVLTRRSASVSLDLIAHLYYSIYLL